MKLRNFFVLSLIVYISIIQISATNQQDEKNNDVDRQLKNRFFDNNQLSGSCSPNPCENKGICTQKGQTAYECRCVGPWRGINCNIADACYNSPCLNGGQCLNVYDDYWCKCPSDYYGNNCQTKYHDSDNSNNNCRPYVCNTGRCVSLKTTYYCECPNDRYGEHCEKYVHKRGISKRQSLYQVLEQLKQAGNKHDFSEDREDDGRAYYDFKNGIYF